MIDLVLGPLVLMGGYFLNGGVGALMQPNANQASGPPPGATYIVTQDGSTQITTQGGTPLVTG